MTPLRVVTVLPLLLLGAVSSGSCQIVGGYDVFERSGAADAGSEARPCDALPIHQKPGLRGPILLLIDDPQAKCFWMDETEVTVGQYREWLDDLDRSGSTPPWDESAWCAFKENAAPFDPDLPGDCQDQAASTRDPFGDDQPIRCVDFCEAEAYCDWAGKRLCKVYGTSNEWQLACTADHTQPYPFDRATPGGSCNYGQSCSLECGPRPTGKEPSCRPVAGYPFDLGGNVAEWIDGCSADGARQTFCEYRGGSYRSPELELRCSTDEGGGFISTRDPAVGFRCCANLTNEERVLLPD